MKFSESWLRELIDLPVETEQLVEQLTMLGMEVKKVSSVSSSCRGVLIGRILECSEIDLGDGRKIFLNRTDVGWGRDLQIVCRDSSCRAEINVIVIPVGAVLPGGEVVSAVDVDGFRSEGRLCSLGETGILKDDRSRVVAKLPPDVSTGMDVGDCVPLRDNILSVSIPPNRADFLGLIGIARDLAVLNRAERAFPSICPELIAGNDRRAPSIAIQPPQICSRYLSRIASNSDLNTRTPLWMEERLRNCGIRLLDVASNIASYVLLELGQPIQMLDHDRVEGNLTIGYTERDESFVLDGKGVRLPPGTLVVRDRVKTLVIAGTAVGDVSRVTADTRNILLSCASFPPRTIAKNTHLHGLNTESSRRYARGVDPGMLSAAVDRFSRLLITICGGEVGPVTEVGDQQIRSPTILLTRPTLRRTSGCLVADEDVHDILSRLGFGVEPTAQGWMVTIPSWRFDVNIQEDLVEEILRVRGYGHVPAAIPRSYLRMSDLDSIPVVPLKLARNLLANLGYQEIISYSFVDHKMQKLIEPHREPLSLRNPISSSMSVMRTSLWIGLVEALIRNRSYHQQRRIRLFESGVCFLPSEKDGHLVDQNLMLSGVVTGPLHDRHWDLPDRHADFYDVKGDLEAILALANRSDVTTFERCDHPALHPGRSANLFIGGEIVGAVGYIHPRVADALDLGCAKIIVFELLWEKLSEHIQPRVRRISPFPENHRDVSVIVPVNTTAAEIVRACRNVSGELIDVKLFDVFRGEGIPEGFKSVSIGLILQSDSHTMSGEEIGDVVSRCLGVLEEKFRAVSR